MHTLTLPTGSKIKLFDSSYKLPECRRVECDYYSLIDSGIGSTMADIDRHFEPLALVINGDNGKAKETAVNNLRYLFYNLLHKQLSPKSLAFCCLVDTIEGETWDDYSPEGLELMLRKLSALGLTDEIVSEQLPEVKKNS